MGVVGTAGVDVSCCPTYAGAGCCRWLVTLVASSLHSLIEIRSYHARPKESSLAANRTAHTFQSYEHCV